MFVKQGLGASLKTLLIAEGVRGMKMGRSRDKKQTVYLQSTMCIFLFVLFLFSFFLCIKLNSRIAQLR